MNTAFYTTQTGPTGDGRVFFKVRESKAFFVKGRGKESRTASHGQFTLYLDIIALQQTLYIPTTLASGKKPTGFVYQIEGTAPGQISTTEVSCKGDGISQVTMGTLLYTKIPQGKTASFRIYADIVGSLNKTYKVVINRINYKLDPSDARYKKFDVSIASKPLTFKD